MGAGMRRPPVGVVVGLLAALTIAAQRGTQPQSYTWDIPAPFPMPPVPADNPMSTAKVELGRHLFYDTRLSANGRQSCASCHRQELAFTDGRAQAIGTTGERHPRGSMSLANVGYLPGLTWAHPTLQALEEQALAPMFGTEPIELGLAGHEARITQLLEDEPRYRDLAAAAYPGERAPWTVRHLTRALAAFERTLISVRSPYDRYRYGGDRNAISESAKRGELFFFSGQRGACFQCHGGWNFSGTVRVAGGDTVAASFFTTGLYNLPGEVSYPWPNTGLHLHTRLPGDVGRFRAPTLRNIAVTAPYMHDGSIATLAEVLDHYAAGGRTTASGVGRDNPNKAPNVHGFAMTAGDRADVIAFLETLTDSAFLRDPRLSNPWPSR